LPPLEILLPSFALLIVSLSVHEAAHAWTADQLGDPTARQLGRLTLNPLSHIDVIGTVIFPLIALSTGLPVLGWAKPVPVNWHNLRAPRRDFAVVAAAGPASNLAMAIAASLALAVVPDGDTALSGQLSAGGILVTAVILNVFLAVFNLLPVPPLDGGNVLAGLVPESVARVIDLMRPWGFLLLYALLFAGVLSAVVMPIARVILRWLL
jgi:Zn-dependent protease